MSDEHRFPVPLTEQPWDGKAVAIWVVALIATGLILWAVVGWAL